MSTVALLRLSSSGRSPCAFTHATAGLREEANIKYRAWGALKELAYGNTRTLSMTYNSRLQPVSFTVPGVMSKTYDYYADGKLKFSHDLIDAKFDRSYSYDHAGRITEALSGAEARNEGTTNLRPYKETFVYDALGHLVERPISLVWSGQGGTFNPSHQTYQNERNTLWQYDAAGNLTESPNVDYTIDAAGQASRVVSLSIIPYNGNPYSTIWKITTDQSRSLDGDGAVLKLVNAETTHDNTNGDETTTATTYLLRSTVLGGKVVTEIDSETGGRDFVYLGSEVLASKQGNGTVKWEHRDPQNASFRMTASTGSIYSVDKAELDPLSTNTGTADPTTVPSLKKLSLYPGWGESIMRGDSQCMWDDLELPCDMHAAANDSRYMQNASQQRGFNQGASTGFGRFDNAAQYGDSMDGWESPLWVDRDAVDGFGHGFFAFDERKIYLPKNLKETVTALVTGNCATFLEQLYRTVAKLNPEGEPQSQEFKVLDVFNSVTGRAGAVVFTPELRSPSGRRIGGTVSGTLGDPVHPPTIELDAYTYYGTLPEAGRKFAEYSYAIRAIHESFHLAAKGGGYGDPGLARAVSAITGKPVPEGDAFVQSDFWNGELKTKCPEIRR